MRRTSRALLLSMGVALVALGILLAWRPWASDPPWRVRVRVLDLAGRPIEGAQVRARYARDWRTTDRDGVVHLAEVPLREREVETPETLADALDVRAKFYGRRSRTPEVSRDAQGRAEVTFRLERHGVVRVIVARARFETARAWVEPDPILRRVEAFDGIEIARSGGEAAWRIYPGLDEVVVHLRGEDGMAWRELRIEPPSLGFVREVVLVPEGAKAISGVVQLPEGAAAPATGALDVFELGADGRPVQYPSVEIAADGGFTVPYTGPGRYALRPRLEFYDVADEGTADAGGFVEIGGLRPVPVVRLRVRGLSDDERKRAQVSIPTRLMIGDQLRAARWDADVLWISTTGDIEPRTAHAIVTLEGTDTTPPKRVDVDLYGHADGPPADVEAIEQPHGRVVVKLLDAPDTGAVVRLAERERTVLPGLRPEAIFEHVEGGLVPVTVSWRGKAGLALLSGDVPHGGTLTLEARPIPGGTLVLEGRGESITKDARDRTLTVESSVHEHVLRLKRLPGTARWTTPEPLSPGTYEGRIEPDDVYDVRFEIRAGEETVVPFELRPPEGR